MTPVMTGGITSVPLPAYWSSKDPEQWRRYPSRTLSCRNPRCAANKINYATNVSESQAKRPRRPYRTSSRRRSASATSNSSTPVEPDRMTRSECVTRCSDCTAPLVPLAQPASSSTTLTPPTPLQVTAAGSYEARSKRSNSTFENISVRKKESPPYQRSNTISNSRAPPPSECDSYSSEESVLCFRKVARLAAEVSNEETEHPVPKLPCSFDPTSTGAMATEYEISVSLTPNSDTNVHEVEDVLLTFTRISVNETTVAVQGEIPENQDPVQEDSILLSSYGGSDDAGSESCASPEPGENGLNFSNDVRAICDKNRISSFYNVLYTPDANTDYLEMDLDMRRGGTEHDLNMKLALEIAVLSAFVTILLLACFPSFLSGVKHYVLNCCSCLCRTVASAGEKVSHPHVGQPKRFERWVYRGAHSLLGCRSPKQAVGSTVLR